MGHVVFEIMRFKCQTATKSEKTIIGSLRTYWGEGEGGGWQTEKI